MKFCLMWVCCHLFSLCVWVACWLGFFVSFWWQQKHSYPFPLLPSSATCWYPVQDAFPVCLHALFENWWVSALCLIFSSLTVQDLSCFPRQGLLSAPSLNKCEICCSQQGLLHMWCSSPSSPIPVFRSMFPKSRTVLPEIFLSGLPYPSHSFIWPWVHWAGNVLSLQWKGSGCNQ